MVLPVIVAVCVDGLGCQGDAHGDANGAPRSLDLVTCGPKCCGGRCIDWRSRLLWDDSIQQLLGEGALCILVFGCV